MVGLAPQPIAGFASLLRFSNKRLLIARKIIYQPVQTKVEIKIALHARSGLHKHKESELGKS